MAYLKRTVETHKMSVPLSYLPEKEELGSLANHFSAYVDQIRQLDKQGSIDTSSFLRFSEVLDDKIASLKNTYESELENLRKDIEVGVHERNSLQAKSSNQQKSIEDLQDKLSVETSKNNKLLDEIYMLQKRIGDLVSKLQGTHNAMQQPQESLDLLEKHVNNLMKEVDQWKHECEREQLATLEVEERLQQVLKKLEFSNEVHNQQIKYYQARLDIASSTILNQEVGQKMNSIEVPVSELLKQEHDKANEDLRNYKIEAKELYTKNLAALKANAADTLQRFSLDKAEMNGSIGQLQAEIRNFEGQVASLQHQNKLLEDALIAERNRAEESIQRLNKRFRDMQDKLMTEMSEVASMHDFSSPFNAEFEAFKVLLEEEERRLQVPVDKGSALTSVSKAMTTDQILTTSNEAMPESTFCNHIPTTADSSTHQALADRKKTDVSSGVTTISPLQTSLTATSVPVTSFMTTDDYSSSYQHASGFTGSLFSVQPLAPLNTFYIPQELRSAEKDTLASAADFNLGYTSSGLCLPENFLPMTGPRYKNYTTSHGWIHPHATPSPPQTSYVLNPIPARSKSAPAIAHKTDTENQRVEESCSKENEVNLDRIDSKYFQKYNVSEGMFQDFQKDMLITKPRPKSNPMDRLPTSDLDYPTSDAIGDLKILEVDKDGRFVKLLNDGPTNFEFGGYIIQQIVSGSPVAVFRFPLHTTFAPDSTITVWSAINDPSVHNPPTDFFCKEQQQWKSGANCTTLLCQANGEVVAWTKAAHRITKDAFVDDSKVQQDFGETNEINDDVDDEAKGNGNLTVLKMDFTRSKSEPVYLRREKRQPPSLAASKHPHGSSPAALIHPHTGQPRPLSFGNDNSTYSRQSRTQTVRPDPIPGLPYTGAPAQRLSSKSSRKMSSSQGTHSSTNTENMTTNKNPVMAIGVTCEGPSPFMSNRNKLATGLKQVCSQHHPDFLPPMPRTLQTSW